MNIILDIIFFSIIAISIFSMYILFLVLIDIVKDMKRQWDAAFDDDNKEDLK